MRQQSPATQAPTYQQNLFGSMSGYGMGGFAGPTFQQNPTFGALNNAPMSEVAQGKQRAQDAMPEFDEAAFERAFAQAQLDMLEEAETQIQSEPNVSAEARPELPVETDPVLLRIREKRPGKLWKTCIASLCELTNNS